MLFLKSPNFYFIQISYNLKMCSMRLQVLWINDGFFVCFCLWRLINCNIIIIACSTCRAIAGRHVCQWFMVGIKFTYPLALAIFCCYHTHILSLIFYCNFLIFSTIFCIEKQILICRNIVNIVETLFHRSSKK